jgi:hypothetical protein
MAGMFEAVMALLIVLAAPPPAGAGLPAPPGGTLDADLTRVYLERAAVEGRQALAELDRDPTRTSAEKAELKRRLAKLRLAVFTTPRTLDACVAAYEKAIPMSRFVFGERDLAADYDEGVRAGAIKVGASQPRPAAGMRGRSARWHREDGAAGVDIEDHLLDPRNGSITKKTVVLVTSLAD